MSEAIILNFYENPLYIDIYAMTIMCFSRFVKQPDPLKMWTRVIKMSSPNAVIRVFGQKSANLLQTHSNTTVVQLLKKGWVRINRSLVPKQDWEKDSGPSWKDILCFFLRLSLKEFGGRLNSTSAVLFNYPQSLGERGRKTSLIRAIIINFCEGCFWSNYESK